MSEMTDQTFGLTFSIEKAPAGGYFMRVGTEPGKIDAARSSLPELMELIHSRAAEKYGEAAWYSPRREMPLAPTPYAVPPVVPNGHDGSDDMPKVVQDYEQRGGPTINRWARSNASVLVPMTLLAWLWVASVIPVGRG